ncbi:M48 family metalloprotease [Haliea atlantica]
MTSQLRFPDCRRRQWLSRALLACLLLPLLVSGCARNPATGGGSVVVMSQGREVQIGDEMHQEILKQGGVYDHPELQAYVDRVGQRLVAQTENPDQTFTFTVVDSPDINAFATPGGFVYINRGLLAYLDNEDELAGVLGHEIAHVTARHAARQRTASITNTVLAVTAGILTGSGQIMDAANMYGTELVRGYGREHELEADGLGAKYMYKAGYDPDALLEVIGVLKNQEQYQRVSARAAGKPSGTYHGLYATHPRNDQRLQTVIRAGRDLGANTSVPISPATPGEFRQVVDGITWGKRTKREEDRFYHNSLGFSIAHPPGWSVSSGASAIVASAPDGSASLTLTLARPTPGQSPQEALESSAQGELSDAEPLEQAGLQGHTAIASAGNSAKRLAVIYHQWEYRFEGAASDFAASDGQLLEMIRSFRPLLPQEKQVGPERTLRYIQVPRGATMASLAAGVQIPDAEAQLRLINGLYPRGEPRVGDWIKIIR